MLRDTQRPGRRAKTALFRPKRWLLASWALCAGLGVHNITHAQTTAGSAIYVRSDSDRTTVIAPRLHVNAPVDETTHIDLVYTTDVWTSASVDIRSSASRSLTRPAPPGGTTPVNEQRDEIDTAITHDIDDVTLSASYRYSHEFDYESHGGSLGGSYSFADKSATLELRLAGAFDQVGRAGDPNFHRPLRNLGARVGFTQVLDPKMFVQVVYELMEAHGYNSSPYRFVGIGTTNALCYDRVTTNVMCIPEASPDERLRHAFGATLRRALGDAFSFGLGYRFYLDSWNVMSHTVFGDLTWNVTRELIVALRYRFYTQGSASHYQTSYDISDSTRQYYTNDKELSSFSAHRLGLDIERAFVLDGRGHELSVLLSAAPSLFSYANYVPLNQITALEVTLATVFKL
jgi:hypothetical protein